MANNDEAAIVCADILYGEKSEVTKIQLLFSLTEVYRMKTTCDKFPDVDLFDHLQIDIKKVAEELEKEIDVEMSTKTPDSQEYNRYLSMKAYTYNIRGDKYDPKLHLITYENHKFLPEFNYAPHFFIKTIKLLEPIKTSREAIYFYTDALNLYGLSHQLQNRPKEALKCFLEAENTYEEFKSVAKNAKEAMTALQIFGVTKDFKIIWCLLTAHHYTHIFLYNCYESLNDDEMRLKYVMLSVKAKISIELSEQGKENMKYHKLVPNCANEINFLIRKLQFAQVNHLLAGFMHHLVQYRRSLPEERRTEVNHVQGMVSVWFAQWAFVLLNYSFMKLSGGEKEDSQINYDYMGFEVLMVPGVEVYEHQFPCMELHSYSELRKTFKKGKAWCQRALDLIGSDAKTFNAKMLMEKYDEIEEHIEIFEDLK
uniref:CSON014488 protein n=1 Tax=Culicoides sonorensis TaxID=179676 RepID=A0A336MN27_CULSO